MVNLLNEHIVYLGENKFNSRKKGPQYCKIPFHSKYIPTFNTLVIKITHVKKQDHFLF